ncbi:MAG: SpoIIE family protein phosphatase [Acidobacteria bacterium]|nr:SpoIIE family protein phosphatase [Acidobacteriota bacterium]MBK9707611.1 SpoIIE family protein phosphatase [Acidobacteriota bacterium]
MPRLIVRATSAHSDSVVELNRLRTTIGRSARNDLCVEDPFASRLHAEVKRRGDSYFISDLGSANGTLMNGTRLTVPLQLGDGDIIRIGETEIEFSERADTSPSRSRTSILLSDSNLNSMPEMTITASSRNSAANLLQSFEAANRTAISPSTAQRQMVNDDTLAVISKVSVTLLSPLSLDETLNQVLECVFEVIAADRGYVMLLEKSDDKSVTEPELVCKALRSRTHLSDSGGDVQMSRSITEQVLKQGASVLTSDAQHDPRFQERKSIMLSGLRSVMAVPIAVEGRVSGMIYVDNPFHINRFTERDLQLLTLIAGVAAIRIENVRLLEVQQEKNRMANELAVASEIQLRLHPDTPPNIPGYDVMGVSFPCYEVGGDYYDFIEKREGQYVVALGDVSGKGTGAALLMSSVHAAVRAYSRTRLSASEIVSEINQYIYDNTPANRYVTMFYSELDPKTNQLTYINGGHNAPLLVRATGEVTCLDIGGFPVGITPFGDYREGWVELEPGDVLVIYSDGASESVNEAGEEFGEQRLIEIVMKHRGRTAAGIRDRIDEALTKFVGKAETVDDLTLVILKRKSGEE